MDLDTIIKDRENFLNALKQIRDDINNSRKEVEYTKTAYENGFIAFKDGIKIVTTKEEPITLSLPQAVLPNVFYKYNDKIYVCLTSGICDEENFKEFMESLYLEDEVPVEPIEGPVEETTEEVVEVE